MAMVNISGNYGIFLFCVSEIRSFSKIYIKSVVFCPSLDIIVILRQFKFKLYIYNIDTGEIFSCGDNRYGKLGLNQKTFNSIQFSPLSVQKYQEIKVENVN